MFTGKKFRLKTAMVGIDDSEGRHHAVTIPASTVLRVLSGPREGDWFVKVSYDGGAILVFAVDLRQHAEEVS